MKDFFDSIVNFFKTAGSSILIGLIILIVGLIIIKIIIAIAKSIAKRNMSASSLSSFGIAILDVVLKVVLLFIALSTMNINSTSIIAVISTCGVAIGLALKDSLSSIASGLIITFNKPFKEGDLIETNGVTGKVIAINLFCTTLCTLDNKKITLPNAGLTSSSIINYDARPTRRVDLTFSAAYGSDIEKVKSVVLQVAKEDKNVLDLPEPSCRLDKQNASSLDFSLKVWVPTTKYWDAYFDLNEKVYTAFCKKGIEIPFNQLDVHLIDSQKQLDEKRK